MPSIHHMTSFFCPIKYINMLMIEIITDHENGIIRFCFNIDLTEMPYKCHTNDIKIFITSSLSFKLSLVSGLHQIITKPISEPIMTKIRVDSRFALSQWEMALLCNDISHWLGESLESALKICNQAFHSKYCKMVSELTFAFKILVSIHSGNGLLPNTQPPPKPMKMYHHREL